MKPFKTIHIILWCLFLPLKFIPMPIMTMEGGLISRTVPSSLWLLIYFIPSLPSKISCLIFLHVLSRTFYCYDCSFFPSTDPERGCFCLFILYLFTVSIDSFPPPIHHFVHRPCNVPIGPDPNHFDVEDEGSMSALKSTMWNSMGLSLLGRGTFVLWSQLHEWKYSCEYDSNVYRVECFCRMLTRRLIFVVRV